MESHEQDSNFHTPRSLIQSLQTIPAYSSMCNTTTTTKCNNIQIHILLCSKSDPFCPIVPDCNSSYVHVILSDLIKLRHTNTYTTLCSWKQIQYYCTYFFQTLLVQLYHTCKRPEAANRNASGWFSRGDINRHSCDAPLKQAVAPSIVYYYIILTRGCRSRYITSQPWYLQ